MAEPARAAAQDELGDEAIVRVDPTEQVRIGRYEICFHVASGGMASVFLARATGPAGFTRPVALKRIHPHLARRREFVAMFLDEARIAARINHPNVCAIHDFGEADGAYFIAMEYLVGVPLMRLMAAMRREEREGRSRFDERRWQALAARMIADAAAGLHAAHELKDESDHALGVVHRDVSPQNVFVTFDGAVKVVDFGIALARDRLQETETGTLKGKLGYMAPEQAASSPVDRRADVWALGVCLWEMLVGARLFQRASPMETLKAVGEGTTPVPSSRRASIPAELDAITMRALARSPEGRHLTARDLARELERFVRATGEPTGLSDLAEWMEPLFADERAHKSEIVHTMLHAPDVSTELRVKTATRTEATEDAPIKQGRVGAVTVSLPGASMPAIAEGVTASLPAVAPQDTTKLPAIAGEPDPNVRDTEKVDASPEPTRAVPAAMTLEPRSRRGMMWVAAGSIAAIAIGAGIAMLPPAAPEPETRAAVAETPSPSPSPSPSPPPSPPPPPSPSLEPVVRSRTATPRPRRDRAPAPQLSTSVAPTFGWVTVAAVGGWAEVWEGDHRLGETPTRLRLRTGPHVLRVVPSDGGPERRLSVTVVEGETTPLIVPVR